MQKPSYLSNYGGFNSLLKSGYRTFKGKNQTFFKNAEAIEDIASMTRTALRIKPVRRIIPPICGADMEFFIRIRFCAYLAGRKLY